VPIADLADPHTQRTGYYLAGSRARPGAQRQWLDPEAGFADAALALAEVTANKNRSKVGNTLLG
jgi:hypothetical protein